MFFPYSYHRSMNDSGWSSDHSEWSSLMDVSESSSSIDEWPLSADELSPSLLLKSRIPRKTKLVDCMLWESFLYVLLKFKHHHPLFRFRHVGEFQINDAHCPLRKGIICYHRDGTIFEHNIHSSGKHEVDSHVAHWESCIRLTMLSSHESLSRNIRRGI